MAGVTGTFTLTAPEGDFTLARVDGTYTLRPN